LSVTTCLLLMLPRTPPFTLFPYTTLFRSSSSALKQFPFLSQPQYQAMYHNLPGGFAPTQWDLFQPRVGIAYQITRNTVVRSGGGYFADRTAINRDTALGGNPPFMPQTTLINGNVANLSGAASAVLPFTMTVQSLTN